MKKMSGAEALVKSLEELGVEHTFGYTGAAILPVYHALGKSSINVNISANEQSAAFSAAGYSRSSDKVGVVIVTSGPAITNTLTSVADSYCDSVPLIVIAGQVPENKIGTDSFQHINVGGIFGDVAKRVVLLSNNQDIESVIKDAYFFAKHQKPGPVVIDMPLNKQQDMQVYSCREIGHYRSIYDEKMHLSEPQCEEFYELLLDAKRPLLYLGGGLNSDTGSASIRRFNEMFRIPSVHTLMAKGVVDERDDLNLGMLGMFGTPYANMIIQENDFFFAIGVRWDDRVAEKVGFGVGSKIAYIDINPKKMHQIRDERNPEFTFLGDAATTIDDLVSYAQKKGVSLDIEDWQKKARQLKRSWPLDYNREAPDIQSAEVIDLLSSYVDENTKITTGVGNHQMLAAQYIRMSRPKSYLTSGSFGTMGFALPSAIGAYHANPDSRIIAIDGDGSLRMNMGELHTIGTLGIPIKVMMLNNRSDGMVRNLQDVLYECVHTGTEREKKANFARIAEACSFNYARRVSDRKELAECMEEFINADGPCFLEVLTDRDEVLYPKVPPGAAYKDMILGPYIKERRLCDTK